MYIVGPDGTSYGYCNDHDPSNVHKVLNAALAKYKAHPPKTAVITEKEKSAAWAHTPIPSTAVIRTFSRIVPVPEGCTMLNKGVGRDYLWLYQEEAKAILALGKRTGQPFKMPGTFALRMARFNLMDNVRGTPDMWKLGEVKKLFVQATEVKSAAGIHTYTLSGSFEMKANSGKRGYSGTLEGEFVATTRDAFYCP